MSEIQECLKKAEGAMGKAHEHTQAAFTKIRAGRAMPNMLDGILVLYYGNATPMNQVASISSPDARTLAIKPWEKKLIPEIEKAILKSKLGLMPQNDGETVRLNIPPLTAERRKDLVKQVKGEAEKGKVAVRNVRKEVKDAFKHLQKEGASEDAIRKAEEQAQKLTDTYIAKIDELLARKEAEVMEV